MRLSGNRMTASAAFSPDISFLRIAEVEKRSGLSRSEIYRRIRQQRFPPPRKLGRRCSVWPSDAIEAWVRVAGLDDEAWALI